MLFLEKTLRPNSADEIEVTPLTDLWGKPSKTGTSNPLIKLAGVTICSEKSLSFAEGTYLNLG